MNRPQHPRWGTLWGTPNMLTDAQIKAALRAVTTEITLTDSGAGRGAGSLKLVIRRLAAGGTSAQWFAVAKRDGRRTKRLLGRYPEFTLAMARQVMAAEVAPALRAGKSLRAAPVGGEPPTLERMLQAFIASLQARGLSYAGEAERALLKAEDNAADAIGRKRAPGEIEPADIAACIAAAYRRGKRGAADKTRAYLSAAFGWAMKASNDYRDPRRVDWGVRANPVAAVPKDAGASKARDRSLAAAEIRAVWKATAPGAKGFALETAACVRLLIACGQRVEETLRAAGAEIDIEAATWRMPAHKTKGRARAHTVPLPPQAVEEFRRLIAVHGDGPLFPGRTGGEVMDHRAVNRALARWRRKAKAAGFQARDLRRTWKSRAGEAGVDRFTRDLIQQHARGDTGSKHYDQTDYLPVMRAAMVRWAEWLDAAIEGRPVAPPENVVRFPSFGVAAA